MRSYIVLVNELVLPGGIIHKRGDVIKLGHGGILAAALKFKQVKEMTGVELTEYEEALANAQTAKELALESAESGQTNQPSLADRIAQIKPVEKLVTWAAAKGIELDPSMKRSEMEQVILQRLEEEQGSNKSE